MASGEPTSGNPAWSRRAAFEVVSSIMRRKLAMDIAISEAQCLRQLTGQDRAFALYVAKTCLRRLGQIDDLIDTCLTSPLPKKVQPVRDVLRVGVTQLLFSETADHAAVSTTVDLCRDLGFDRYVGLTNAIMRRLQREGGALLEEQNPAQLNTPAWLWESWCETYGETVADAIGACHMSVPPLDITPKNNPSAWAEQLNGALILEGTVRLTDASDVTAMPGFESGDWWVQDAAARLPVCALGNVTGLTVYDLCAAPGGKTMELAARGAKVTALDISKRRLDRLQENLSRVGLDADVINNDARKWDPGSQADVVVLDAPCSSTGTVRRHPEVQHIKTLQDMLKLEAVQDSLLDAAATLTKPGGRLLYVTCSLQPEEGPDRVDAFLARTPGFRRVAIEPASIGGFSEAVSATGDLRTTPAMLAGQGGLDGFFAAILFREGG